MWSSGETGLSNCTLKAAQVNEPTPADKLGCLDLLTFCLVWVTAQLSDKDCFLLGNESIFPPHPSQAKRSILIQRPCCCGCLLPAMWWICLQTSNAAVNNTSSPHSCWGWKTKGAVLWIINRRGGCSYNRTLHLHYKHSSCYIASCVVCWQACFRMAAFLGFLKLCCCSGQLATVNNEPCDAFKPQSTLGPVQRKPIRAASTEATANIGQKARHRWVTLLLTASLCVLWHFWVKALA